jgi:DNA transposition AAA+ family ATPase
MGDEAKLNIVGGGKNVGDEELRQWLAEFIENHPHLTVVELSRSDYIGYSRPALDAYLKGTYFLGTNPSNSNLEKKIRAFREKMEGVNVDGFTTEFLQTRLWQQFQYLCKVAITEKRIVIGYGRPGAGKSRALQQFKVEKMTTMPIEILCSRNITTRYFVQKLAKELKISPSHGIAELEDLIAEKLKKGVARLIIVDQANYLGERSLGTICYIWEKTRVPIVLLGTKDLYDSFMNSNMTEDVRAQLTSRVAWHSLLDELSEEEVINLASKILGKFAKPELITKIWEITQGNHRHLEYLLPRVAGIVKMNEAEIESGEFTSDELVEKAGQKLLIAA